MRKEIVRQDSGNASRARREVAPPQISPRLLRFFGHYADSYLARHFHSVRLLKNSAPPVCEGFPLVVYLNHSSWWDPLVSLLLARRFFTRRQSFGPIEAAALGRYRFFERLGFFGVKTGSRTGAEDFLATATAILRSEKNALWITPQGKFADFHARPVAFMSGLSHLTKHVERAAFLPLAIQYVYWEERLPEILLGFGEPIIFRTEARMTTRDATQLFASALTAVQDHLADASARRDSDEWQIIIKGRAGVNAFYDLWRRARARLRGEEFDPSHSEL
ncbi:MAG: lysophospholipid acyltransferase family protein [Chthoniobacterales bacterium]